MGAGKGSQLGMFGHPGSAVLEKLWTVLAEGAEGKASFEHEVGAR